MQDIDNLGTARSLLAWDQRTQMPPQGAGVRAGQIATLSRIYHEMFTSETTARLIEEAANEVNGADYESDEASLIRLVQRDYEDATKLPTDFVKRMSELTSRGQQVWAKARAEKDFVQFQPVLEQLIDMTLEEAALRGYDDHPYDALLDQFDRDLKTADVKAIFDTHKPALIDLIAAVSEQQDRVDDSCLHQHFDIDQQRAFALDVVKAFGFDFERGRQDTTVHPFAMSMSRYDTRITTRFNDDFLNPALFGMMHEAGHGMHGQGFSDEIDCTPLAGGGARGYSMSVAESQSRTWENLVGRSRGFWQWAFPKLQAAFPGQFDDVDLDTFYGAVNRVQPSLIRVEADEATYNLHIMVRFELELELVSGSLKVADLPDAWNAKYQDFLGIIPPDAALGVLQDVHWSSGAIGYFPTYALGNLLAVQYYNKALQDHPSIPDEIAAGKFDTLLKWQTEHIHQHGRKFNADEMTRRVTGEGMQSQDYIAYLQAKYSDIYGLS
jgi:carboxypeptidase Taq